MEEKLKKRLDEIYERLEFLDAKLYFNCSKDEYDEMLEEVEHLNLEKFEIWERLNYLKGKVVASDNEIELLSNENDSISCRRYDIYLNKKIKVGNIEYRNCDSKYLGNVGYDIYESFQGNGYATRAFKLLNNILALEGIDSILVTAYKDNLASIKVIEKVGGEFVGVNEDVKDVLLYKCYTDINKKVR